MIMMYLQILPVMPNYNYDPIVYNLFIANAPLPLGGGIIYVLICTLTDFFKATSHCRLPALCYLSGSSSG